MQQRIRKVTGSSVALLLVGAFLLAGCSSSPSEEQMRQLSDLKAEVEALGKEVSANAAKKADLEKQIAELTAKIQKANADMATVKQRLAK
jgi:septal ring factor EnvC (AmiA/AmiB activator)